MKKMKVKPKWKTNFLPVYFFLATVLSFFLHNGIYGLFKFEEGVFFTLTLVCALGFVISSLIWLVKFIIKLLKL